MRICRPLTLFNIMAVASNYLKLIVVLFVLLFVIIDCVDRNNFKKCEESGFCRRHRNGKSSPSQYAIIPESFVTQKTKVTARLREETTGQELLLSFTKLRGRSFRLHINDANPVRTRYEIPIGDSLVKEPEEDEIKVGKQGDGEYIIKGEQGLHASITMRPFKITVLSKDKPVAVINSRNLLKMENFIKKAEKPAEEEKPPTVEEGKVDDGKEADKKNESEELKEEKPDDGVGEEDFRGHRDSKPHGSSAIGFDVRFGPGFSHVYGIPEHADSLSLRDTTDGDPYRLYNLDVFEYELNNPMALYGSVPVMWAHNKDNTIGLFLHNPTEMWIDIDKKSSSTEKQVDTHWIAESGVIDAFIIVSEHPKDALYQYAFLTGTTPLPPLFAIAYHQCRWNYNDQKDLLDVHDNFDKYDIPVDVLWLDIEHTDGKKYFTWDAEKFPDPVEMVDKLAAHRRKLVTVVDPHIKRESGWDLYKEASDKGVFVKDRDNKEYEGWCWPGSSSWPDFMNPAVRKWWAELFLTYKASRADNTYTWNDMGEPSIFNGPEVTMHKDAIHHEGREHREVHNLFGMQIQRASWEGQLLRSENHERPFVLTRAFFAGSQRFGAVWTGDNTAEWSHLAASLPMVMSIGLSGVTLSGADVGGFFKNTDAELLIRWYQAGAFQPFFRAHAHLDTKRREPWLYEKHHMAAIRKAIRLRYSLLPYMYTHFYRAETTGEPLMSPLWLHFPKDERTFDMEKSHMFGDSFLVQPVVGAGVTSVSVYLPGDDKTVWYNAHDLTAHKAGQEVEVSVDLETIPIFMLGGTVVPKKERIRRAANLGRYDPYTIVVALDGDLTATGRLYIDDYHTLRYRQRKEFCYMQLRYERGVLRSRRIDLAAEYDSKSTVERVVIIGLPSRPNRVTSNSEARVPVNSEFTYEPDKKVLVVRKPSIDQITDEWFVRLHFDSASSQRDDL